METIVLGERCTLENVGENRELILSAMERSKEGLLIDLTDLQDIDTAGIQLLVSGIKESEKQGYSLEFKGPLNPVIAEAILTSGIHYGELI